MNKKFKFIILAGIMSQLSMAYDTSLIRDFKLSTPLFSEQSAWRQKADTVSVLPSSDATLLTTYRVLKGYGDELVPYEKVEEAKMWLNTQEWSYAIYRAKSEQVSIDICMYNGYERHPEDVFGGDIPRGGPVMVDAPAGIIRPAAPAGDSDGHLILINPETNIAWEYWEAATERESRCPKDGSVGGGIASNTLLQAGAATFFDLTKDGVSSKGSSSAAASGVSLLSGLLLPEDFESNEILHALKFSIPGPRNLSPNGDGKLKTDYVYPATSTEDKYGRMNKNKNAMIMGTRMRLKNKLIDENGKEIDEDNFSPATKMVLKALRKYGAYLVDNAGSFAFYAEDSHSGKLDVSNERLSYLTSGSIDTSKTPWDVLISKVQKELFTIPLAYGSADTGGDASSASIIHANFDMVEHARHPSENNPDSIAPVITINGSDIHIEKGNDYHEEGANAIDNIDGYVLVQITGDVDTSKIGIYTITYTAKDNTGNTATKTRTVTVGETTTPNTEVQTLSPSGEISQTRPTFKWHGVENASHYELGFENTKGGEWKSYIISAEEANCQNGQMCYYTPNNITFKLGDEKSWWVRAKSSTDWGKWSEGKSFSIIETDTGISPSGEISQTRPTFKWHDIENASHYELGFENTKGGEWKSYIISAEEANCQNGQICHYTPNTITFKLGDEKSWWVRAKSSTDWGNWSEGKSFSIITNTLSNDDYLIIDNGAGVLNGHQTEVPQY